jgi:OOP family OmpA-OmpF porin
MKNTRFYRFLAVALAAILLPFLSMAQDAEDSPWYFSPGLGMMDFEGDQDFEDGAVLSLRLGYDFNERWTFEGAFHVAPSLENNPDVTTAWSSASAFQLAVDGLFHFTRWERLDPYLAVGLGFINYSENPVDGEQANSVIRGGGGVMYHFNDEWAIRADYRAILAGFGDDPNANAILDGGVVWTWGAHVPMKPEPKDFDSDGDGLTDIDEQTKYNTDYLDPDTDHDRLTDGQEILDYNTNPLDPDSDIDMLTDGQEVLDYGTDPNDQDTDDGGVFDGHEVLEDGTNPQKGHGHDDLIRYTLNIEFDTDKALIKPAYFDEIDIIGKVLKRNPAATATIEGHADKRRKSKKEYNQVLSEKRAASVKKFLEERWGIADTRLKSVGYGFTKPIAKNDPKEGNHLNRRVEVYIRGVTKEDAAEAAASALVPDMNPEDK